MAPTCLLFRSGTLDFGIWKQATVLPTDFPAAVSQGPRIAIAAFMEHDASFSNLSDRMHCSQKWTAYKMHCPQIMNSECGMTNPLKEPMLQSIGECVIFRQLN